MRRREPDSSQGAFRDRPGESHRSLTTSLPDTLHSNILTRPPEGWEHRSDDSRQSGPSRLPSQGAPTGWQLPPLSEILPGFRGGSEASSGPLPPLRATTAFPPLLRSTSASPASADYGESQRYTHTFQQRQASFPSIRDSPPSTSASPASAESGESQHYTSLPRYRAGPSNALPSRHADPEDARHPRELPLPPHEGHYEATSSAPLPVPQRSYTFPATSDERAYSQHRPAVVDTAHTNRARHIGSGSATPPLSRQSVTTRSPFQGSSHAYRVLPAPIASNAPGDDRRASMLVSPGPVSVPTTTRGIKDPRELGRLRAEYAYPQEVHFRHSQHPSHPFPMTSSSSSKARRLRSASLDRDSRASTSLAEPGIGSSNTGQSNTGSGGGYRNHGGREAGQPSISNSASREESRTPAEPPIFWGRQQRMAHAASIRGEASSLPSMIAPAPRRTGDPPIHPELLGLSGHMQAEVPIPGPSRYPRALAKKGKEKVEEYSTSDFKGAPSDEVDELHESSDDDSRPQFSVGSSGPSRTGSAGGTRAPRTKIEVACDFCRKRKMKCDGLRPTCKNCQRKGVACSYIPVVRRRGPGKKKKAIEARPKKSNKRVEEEKQLKSRGGDDVIETELQARPRELGGLPPGASGSNLQAEDAAHQFPPAFSPARPTNELYLPSQLQQMPSPRGKERVPARPRSNISPFSSSGGLPFYPPEQFPPYGQSPTFGGNLFLPGQSPTMGTREVAEPYAGVGITIPDSGGGLLSEVGGHGPALGTARTASMFSSTSGRSSSEGETGRQSRRRRSSKRARTDDEQGELEEGEIEEERRPSGR